MFYRSVTFVTDFMVFLVLSLPVTLANFGFIIFMGFHRRLGGLGAGFLVYSACAAYWWQFHKFLQKFSNYVII